MSVIKPTLSDMHRAVSKALRAHWRLFMAQGVIMVILGTVAIAGSPAEKAGITAGDVITKVNGQPISTASDLRNKTGLMPIGTELHITLIRKGASQEVTAELAEANAKR